VSEIPSDALARMHDVALVDLDGVVYIGAAAVPRAIGSLSLARAVGQRHIFVTNNASRTPEEVAAHLNELGLEASAADVLTSSQAGAALLARRLTQGARVLAVGGPGVRAALVEEGLVPVARADERPDAVMQGFGRDVGWVHLAEAALAVSAGAVWLATNLDRTLPVPGGRAPGNGMLVAAVAEATGREPDLVAGKPDGALLTEAVRRTSAQRPIVIGDRLDTDIAAAHRAGLPSLLVLTGVTDAKGLGEAPPGQQPTYVSDDLSGLIRAGRTA
jgi:glycerol-1-phosphatase